MVHYTDVCCFAFQTLQSLLLSELGLVVNAKKTVTNSQPVLASFPDFAFDECPRLLGGYVGSKDAEMLKLS